MNFLFFLLLGYVITTRISQQQKRILPITFIIFLVSSDLFKWCCYLKDILFNFGWELFNYLFSLYLVI